MKRAAVPSILFAVVLLALGVIAEAQQPTEIPPERVSIGGYAVVTLRSKTIRLDLTQIGNILVGMLTV